jgi:hypothetical protein
MENGEKGEARRIIKGKKSDSMNLTMPASSHFSPFPFFLPHRG